MTKPSRSRSKGREASCGIGVAARQGAQVAEAGQRHGRHRHVAGAGHADVHPAQFQPLPCLRQGVIAAGARRGHAGRRAGQGQMAARAHHQRFRILMRFLNGTAAGHGVGLPGFEPFARRRPAPDRRAPRAGLSHQPASRKALTQHQRISCSRSVQLGERDGIFGGRTGHRLNLARDLTGMFAHVKARDGLDAGAPRQQVDWRTFRKNGPAAWPSRLP